MDNLNTKSFLAIVFLTSVKNNFSKEIINQNKSYLWIFSANLIQLELELNLRNYYNRSLHNISTYINRMKLQF